MESYATIMFVSAFIYRFAFECLSVCLSVGLCVFTCPRYIMRLAICTAVLSEVRVGTVCCYGVKMGLWG